MIGVEQNYQKYTVTPGVTTYAIPFTIFKETDLIVTYTDTSGVETVLILGTDYTVTIFENGHGEIELLTGATDGELLLFRDVPITQEVDWVNNDPFDMEILEGNQDKFIVIMQQLDDAISRAIVAPPGTPGGISLPAPDAGKALKWNDTEDNIINSIYNVDEVGQQASDAADRAEEAADKAEFYSNITQSKVDVVPVGTILPWIGGYFTTSANGGFTDVLGNTQAAVKSYLAGTSYALCNGDLLNDADSPIFNGAGRYLPNLTDDRFISGGNAAGVVGGANEGIAGNHTHATGDHILTVAQLPAHGHNVTPDGQVILKWSGNSGYLVASSTGLGVSLTNINVGQNGGGLAHNHGSTGMAEGASGDNRPNYLTAWFIMKYKFEDIPEDYEYFTVLRPITP